MNGDTEELLQRMIKAKIPKYMHYFGVHMYRFNYKQVKHIKKIMEVIEELWKQKGHKNYETK